MLFAKIKLAKISEFTVLYCNVSYSASLREIQFLIEHTHGFEQLYSVYIGFQLIFSGVMSYITTIQAPRGNVCFIPAFGSL